MGSIIRVPIARMYSSKFKDELPSVSKGFFYLRKRLIDPSLEL
jgi:hypothetical protein